MLDTINGNQIDSEILSNYFKSLVNRFFKILPMKEQQEESLVTYMINLRDELLGAENIIASINSDPSYLSLVSILQYLIDNIDNSEECSTKKVRRLVFQTISICNKLRAQYEYKEVIDV